MTWIEMSRVLELAGE